MAAVAEGFTGRKNHGRGHSYWIDGVKVPGITTILGKGIPKPQFVDAAAKTTAHYAIDYWDDLSAVNVSERLTRLLRARWESLGAASVRGTAVHAYVEQLAAGAEVDPGDLAGHVDAYLQFVEEWNPVEILVEVPFFSRRIGYAGTPDLVAVLADGQTWLLDWKTAEWGIWPEAALQLAAARFAEFYIDGDGNEVSVASLGITQCGAIHIRADGYDLRPTFSGREAFEAFLYAKHVAEFADTTREDWVGDALRPPIKKGNR